MTVSVPTASQSYEGDGSTTSFPTVFVFGTSADIEVIERVVATGAETTLALTTDYTVSGGGGAGAEPATGTVTAVTAPPSTATWTVRRIVAETQTTDLPTAGALPSASVETMSDRLTMQIQQHSEEIGRTLTFPKTDSAALDPTIPNSVDRASKLLAFTSDGTPTVRDLSDGGTGTMSNLVDDETPQLGGDLDLNGNSVDFPSTPNISDVLDEDDMSSNSATALATQQSVKAYVDAEVASAQTLADLPRSYLAGLTMSNDTDSDHDIAIAVGECRDAADSVNMALSSILTKQIDATWAAGDDAGGMNDGDTVGTSEWFHVFLLSNADGTTVDAGFDTSLTAAGLLADTAVVAAGHTKYRRIGSVLTNGSSNILAFTQVGDDFWWDVTVADLTNGVIATAGTTITLTVPTGLKVHARFNASVGSHNSIGATFYSPDITGGQPSNTSVPVPHANGTGENASPAYVLTNTSAQIIARAGSAMTDASISTLGWRDSRGRDD